MVPPEAIVYVWSLIAADLNGDGKPDLIGIGAVLLNTSGAATVTRITTSLNPSFSTQEITFTATVTSKSRTIPDGKLVTFHEGTTVLASVALAGGVASYSTSSLAARIHTIKASYAGDTTLAPSTGWLMQAVDKYPTTTALNSSPNPSSHSRAVTLTATVTPTGPYPPTGKVRFKDGTTGLETVTLNGGVANLTERWLAAGTHQITAQYLGDAATAKSTSAVLNQVVQ
jgi:hypothetical protein